MYAIFNKTVTRPVLSRFGVLSTHDSVFEGFPAGAIVGFASDDQGRPLFSFSSMSSHTADVKRDGRASLTVTAQGFTVRPCFCLLRRDVCM